MKTPYFLLMLLPLIFAPLAAAPADVSGAKKIIASLTASARKGSGMKAKRQKALANTIRRLAKEPGEVNVGSKDKGITPLILATALGEKEAIHWLLALGADPYLTDKDKKDSFARTKDKAIIDLFRKNSIDNWDEALKHLNNAGAGYWIPAPEGYEAETREQIIKACEELAQGNEDASLHPYTLAVNFTFLGDHKMLSFIARQYDDWNFHGMSPFYHAAIVSPPQKEKRLAAFCLLDALTAMRDRDPGWEGTYWLAHPDVKEDAKVQRWLLRHLGTKRAISLGSEYGLLGLVKAAVRQARHEKLDDETFRLCIAKAMVCAFVTGDTKFMDYLLKQTDEVMCDKSIYRVALLNNRIDMLKAYRPKLSGHLVAIDYIEMTLDHDNVDEQEVLGDCLSYLNSKDSFLYVKGTSKKSAASAYRNFQSDAHVVECARNATSHVRALQTSHPPASTEFLPGLHIVSEEKI